MAIFPEITFGAVCWRNGWLKIAIINPVWANISGGYREYLKQILSRAAIDPAVEKILFISIPRICSDFAEIPKVETFSIGFWYHLFPNNRTLKERLEAFSPDILYSPVEKRLPHLKGIPGVIMIQNMEPFIPFSHQNSWLQNLRLRLLRRMAVSAIRNADHVIALSEFVLKKLMDEYQLKPSKVSKIPHGAEFKASLEASQPGLIKRNEKFIFTAGSISPARGLEDIIDAFIVLKREQSNKDLKLIIAGGKQRFANGYYNKLRTRISQAGLEPEVIWLGFISQAEMKWCFKNCQIFVMTSRVESFGITAVEAMTYGARVISTRSPCLPEVFGDYAEYYNPADSGDLSSQINKMLAETDKSGRQLKQPLLPDYDWQSCYIRTVSLFADLTVRC